MLDTATAATDLRNAVGTALTAAGRPVLRAFTAPGLSAAWDTCCQKGDGEGQASVAVERVYPTEDFPIEAAGLPMRCGPGEYAAVLAVEVMRCAHTVNDQGKPPTAEQVTGDADKVAADRQTVWDAILCDFLADADPGTWTLGAWEPLGPNGGCVGGLWRVTVAVDRP